jgi:hypothetical protein
MTIRSPGVAPYLSSSGVCKMQHIYQVGDCVVLDDGEKGVIIAANDDGTAHVRTESGILISSCLDEIDIESRPGRWPG